MLVTITDSEGRKAYRVDCDGCGQKDEHDRGPRAEIILAHMEVEDAYASAACTECENSPQIVQVNGKDLCKICRGGEN